ncbi:Zn-ribbon domain-containing OB-fold protein [Streptacidiphilus sp. N1-3]|uniref:Zn-ribbon domain-containing OB-fold protein n=1 Tax=Streptacidiphilus alkalitolerans TaxID=3342712 RepID=A0ABV6X4U6_9ACTN
MSGAASSLFGPTVADRPEPDAFTRPYWEAAAEGRLLLRRCGACGRAHHYPREFCPYCWSEDVRWEQASGEAVLYTWSVVRVNDLPPFRDRLPYVAAVVDLAEGPRMMTAVVDCDPLTLCVGMRLHVTLPTGLSAGEDGSAPIAAPVFRPADR